MDTPKVISGDSRTASEDTVLSPSVSPDQGTNEPTAPMVLLDQIRRVTLEMIALGVECRSAEAVLNDLTRRQNAKAEQVRNLWNTLRAWSEEG